VTAEHPDDTEARGFAQSVFGAERKHPEPEHDPVDDANRQFVQALFGTTPTDE
jgi:hypothetical protein